MIEVFVNINSIRYDSECKLNNTMSSQ